MADALTILVVDDSAAMREILGVILSAGGHAVMFAENIDVGLDLAERRAPDLVLTDYTMPGGNGLELVLRLRTQGFDRPIFAVSSERDPALRAAMARAGANAWFPKPICAATLLRAVDALHSITAPSGSASRPRVSAGFAQVG